MVPVAAAIGDGDATGCDMNPPHTLSEAVDRLLKELDAEQREKLRALPEDDLLNLHFGLGMSIRNSFPIWGNTELLHSIAVEWRPRVAAEMERLVAAAEGNRREQKRIRKFFGRILARESIDADDASFVIIRAAWERLRGEGSGA